MPSGTLAWTFTIFRFSSPLSITDLTQENLLKILQGSEQQFPQDTLTLHYKAIPTMAPVLIIPDQT